MSDVEVLRKIKQKRILILIIRMKELAVFYTNGNEERRRRKLTSQRILNSSCTERNPE